jgi:hypothetical protein
MNILRVPFYFPACVLALSLPAAALQIRTLSPAAHERITNFPGNPTLNPTFLNPGGNLANLPDLTGVGWNTSNTVQQFTLVSPRHFVGANHFRPGVGSVVRFLARDNTLHDYTIAATYGILNDDGSTSDVFLGELATDVVVTTGIRPLPYLNLAAENAYTGEALVVLGQPARGGRGTIGPVSDFGGDPITSGSGIKTRAFTFTYGPAGSADDAKAEVGDSGSPSLTIRSGQLALVGTHTAVLTAFGSTTTYDTLVPHYASRLNSVMESQGYHLRKFTPDATAFTASGAGISPVIRALKPFVFRVSMTNGAAAADNVTASFTLPVGAVLAGTTASGWIVTNATAIRRGGLAAGETVTVDLAFSKAPVSGSFQIGLNLTSDGSAAKSFNFPLTVTPSYAEWADGLADASLAGDADGDGVGNLLEYAFGGNNREASQFLAGASPAVDLLPQFMTAPARLRFLRRQDFAARGLRQIIETSENLDSASWTTLVDTGSTAVSTPAAGFELIELPLSDTTAARRFYRFRVELDEP